MIIYYLEYTPERWEVIKTMFSSYIENVMCWNLFNLIYYYPMEVNTRGYISNCDIQNIRGFSKRKCNSLDEFINIIKEDNMKEFIKSDLKSGMVVKLNNNQYYLVVDNILIGTCGQMPLKDYDENLYLIDEQHKSAYSIKEVYQKRYRTWGMGFNDSIENNLVLLWQRKNVEYTMQEIADKLGIPVELLRIKK